MGDLSAHFDSSEFRDRRTGERRGPSESFLRKLEALRSRIGRPLPVLSGFRSKTTNRLVGGARQSWHLRGRAADLPEGLVTIDQARDAGFTGIGVRNGWVVHVDDRPTRVVIFLDR